MHCTAAVVTTAILNTIKGRKVRKSTCSVTRFTNALYLGEYFVKEGGESLFEIPSPGWIQKLLNHEVLQRMFRDGG